MGFFLIVKKSLKNDARVFQIKKLHAGYENHPRSVAKLGAEGEGSDEGRKRRSGFLCPTPSPFAVQHTVVKGKGRGRGTDLRTVRGGHTLIACSWWGANL